MVLDCLVNIIQDFGIDMNERIKLLAERCGFKSNPNIYDRNQSFDIEKFAELIVRECVEVVKWTPSQYPNDEYVKNIKAHFGVE